MNSKCLIHKTVFLLPAFTAAAVLASLIPELTGPGNMPQQNSGDPLALIFGDVRMLISNKMIAKADQYYHGGVTEVEHCSHDDNHFHGGAGHAEADNGESNGHDDSANDGGKDDHADPYDPWASLKRAIRLPDIDRHLTDEKSRELLPWFWAAIKLDPENVNAYLDAAYVLQTTHSMPEKALEILDAGLNAMPESADIEFAKGLLLLREFKRTDDAARAVRNAIADLDGKTDEDSLLLMVRSCEILGKIASDCGDTATLRDCFEKANAAMPDHSCTRLLKSLLQ